MYFDVHVLEKRKIRFDQAFAPGTIDLLDLAIHQIGDLHVAGVAELIDPTGVREIRVQGRLEGEVEVNCARCLQPMRVLISGPVDLFYRPMAQIAREEEVSITEAETEVGFYVGGGVELADVIREQVLTQLPMRSICREDCQGICPICGRNRNVEPCACREEFVDPRWDALRHWRN